MIEGKFRDFMVGWIADQLQEPDLTREELEQLYDAVVLAGSDVEAFTAVEAVLGQASSVLLWGLSKSWADNTVKEAQAMLTVLRDAAQEDHGDPSRFYLFFLNPFKTGCVPDGFEDDVLPEISWMFRLFYSAAAQAVLAPIGWQPSVVVEPSYEAASHIIILAQPQAQSETKVFLLQRWTQAWQFRFANLAKLAGELLALRHLIEQSATRAILGYHLAQTAIEVMGEGGATLTATQQAPHSPAVPVERHSLEAFAHRLPLLVTNLNGMTGALVNDELTAADFDHDLTELLARLNEVEAAIHALGDVFWRSSC